MSLNLCVFLIVLGRKFELYHPLRWLFIVKAIGHYYQLNKLEKPMVREQIIDVLQYLIMTFLQMFHKLLCIDIY